MSLTNLRLRPHLTYFQLHGVTLHHANNTVNLPLAQILAGTAAAHLKMDSAGNQSNLYTHMLVLKFRSNNIYLASFVPLLEVVVTGCNY